jgi:hypothetical protein
MHFLCPRIFYINIKYLDKNNDKTEKRQAPTWNNKNKNAYYWCRPKGRRTSDAHSGIKEYNYDRRRG